jgi:hypothetical protein
VSCAAPLPPLVLVAPDLAVAVAAAAAAVRPSCACLPCPPCLCPTQRLRSARPSHRRGPPPPTSPHLPIEPTTLPPSLTSPPPLCPQTHSTAQDPLPLATSRTSNDYTAHDKTRTLSTSSLSISARPTRSPPYAQTKGWSLIPSEALPDSTSPTFTGHFAKDLQSLLLFTHLLRTLFASLEIGTSHHHDVTARRSSANRKHAGHLCSLTITSPAPSDLVYLTLSIPRPLALQPPSIH